MSLSLMISCILVIVSKKHQNAPESSAIEEAEKMGVRLMNEEEYRYLQTLGESDLKTSSWVVTSERIRCLGGAIFVNVGTMKFLHFIMKLIATIVHVAFAA